MPTRLLLSCVGVEFSEVAEELLHDCCFIAVGRGFVTGIGDVEAFAVDILYGFDEAFLVKGDEDDALLNHFGVENAAFFSFLTDIVPHIRVECGFGRGGA